MRNPEIALTPDGVSPELQQTIQKNKIGLEVMNGSKTETTITITSTLENPDDRKDVEHATAEVTRRIVGAIKDKLESGITIDVMPPLIAFGAHGGPAQRFIMSTETNLDPAETKRILESGIRLVKMRAETMQIRCN